MPVFINENGIDKEVDMIFANVDGIDKLVAGGGGPSSFVNYLVRGSRGTVGSWSFSSVQIGDLLVIMTTNSNASMPNGFVLHGSSSVGRLFYCIWDGSQPTSGNFGSGIQNLVHFRGASGLGVFSLRNLPSGSTSRDFPALAGVKEGNLVFYGIMSSVTFELSAPNQNRPVALVSSSGIIQIDRFVPVPNFSYALSSTIEVPSFSMEVVI